MIDVCQRSLKLFQLRQRPGAGVACDRASREQQR